MDLFIAVFSGQFYWNIHKDNSPIFDLTSIPQLFFLNPLLYGKIDQDKSDKLGARIILVAGDFAVMQTNGFVIGTHEEDIDVKSIPLTFEIPQYIELPGMDRDRRFDFIPAYCEALAINLRQASKQVTIPNSIAVVSKYKLERLPEMAFPAANNSNEVMLQKYISETAIFQEMVEIADCEIMLQKTPIYEKLLLDAIHAYKDKDYRRAILYTAMSLETITATKLEDAYEQITVQGDPTKTHRLIQFHAKNSVAKDPIYVFLRERSKFADLLHVVSLYILERSMLLSNEQLYQNALKVYRTRNKIAHTGEVSSKQQEHTYPINQNGALEAIRCGVEVFRWFGEKGDFPLPTVSFVRGQAPSIE